MSSCVSNPIIFTYIKKKKDLFWNRLGLGGYQLVFHRKIDR